MSASRPWNGSPRLVARGAVLLGLLAAGIGAGPGPLGAAAPGKGPDFRALALLPGRADLVLSLDTLTLRRSNLVAEMESRFDSIPEAAERYREFVRESGIDPRRDTDQVVMSLRLGDSGDTKAFLVVAQGQYQSSRVVEAAAERGGSLRTSPAGRKYWSAGETPGPGGVALAQPDPGMLLFGTESEVLRALEVQAGAKAAEPKAEKLRDLIGSVDRRAPVWAVFNSAILTRHISGEVGRSNPDWPGGEALAAVDSMTLSAWVGSDVDLKFRINARDPESAWLLADMVRGTLAAGKLAAKESDPELLRILQETLIGGNANTVEIRTRIPASRFRLDGKKPD